MRFIKPEPGTVKVKKVFLFLPKTFGAETRWLEFANILMEVNYWRQWSEIDWYDEENRS